MLDVLIVGAGISGISAACHLELQCPGKTYEIIEARSQLGGTWDLFKYPGVRSDSDMHTFGFKFKPWTNAKALADGPSILKYLQETVKEYQLTEHIRYSLRVVSAAWSSESNCWTVTSLNTAGEEVQHRARVLFMCSGYYDYERGYTPEIPGLADFAGQLVHPQHWPENLDYKGKQVVVIGSGATAMTLVPAMADSAAKVTMIQRSPTYVVSMPSKDRLANLMNTLLPVSWAYKFTRWRNILFQNYFYKRSRSKPEKVKAYILKLVRKELGADYDVDKHFTPSYMPWDERLCLVPDADLFNAINEHKAEVVTETITRITETGVQLHYGEVVPADILVTATGLNLKLLGGVQFSCDDEAVDLTQRFFYQGMMFSNIPNLLQTFGYTNASWTLRADLNSEFLCRALNHFDETKTSMFVPELEDDSMQAQPWMSEFQPGYMKRGEHLFPKLGDHSPWLNTQNYLLDRKLLNKGPLEDGVLKFY